MTFTIYHFIFLIKKIYRYLKRFFPHPIWQSILAYLAFCLIFLGTDYSYSYYAAHTPHRKNTYPEVVMMVKYLSSSNNLDPERWDFIFPKVSEEPSQPMEPSDLLDFTSPIDPYYEIQAIRSKTATENNRIEELSYSPTRGYVFLSSTQRYHLTDAGVLTADLSLPREEQVSPSIQRQTFEKEIHEFIGPILDLQRQTNFHVPYEQLVFDWTFYHQFH